MLFGSDAVVDPIAFYIAATRHINIGQCLRVEVMPNGLGVYFWRTRLLHIARELTHCMHSYKFMQKFLICYGMDGPTLTCTSVMDAIVCPWVKGHRLCIYWIEIISKLSHNMPTNQIINSRATTDQLSLCVNPLKCFESTKLDSKISTALASHSKWPIPKLGNSMLYQYGLENHLLAKRIQIYLD